MPPQPSQQPEPDLDNDPIELGSGGGPPAPPGGGTLVPVPEDDSFDLEMFMDSGNTDEGHPPGGGRSGYGPSPDEPPVQMEYHDEAPPPGGPPGAPGAVPQFSLPDQVLSPPMPWPAPATPIVPVPIPPHPQFPLPQSLRPPSPRHVAPTRARGAHPDDISTAKARASHPLGPPVVLLPGRIPYQKVTSRNLTSQLRLLLGLLRFQVCL